jgi:arsenate reductase
MKLLFVEYPKCTTCKRAKTWLEEQGVEFEDRDIKTNNPNKEELEKWYKLSGFPLKKFFNTSGLIYKSMNLKDKLADMSEDEQLELLATDGMLVKRPVLVGEDFVLTGFKAEKWLEKIKK